MTPDLAILLASLATVLLQAWLHHRSLRYTLYQHEQAIRAARAQNDKLTSKLMAMTDARMFSEYRMASSSMVPEGSIPPVFMEQPPNGKMPTREDLERIQAEVSDRIRRRMAAAGSNPGGVPEGPEP